MSTLFSYILFAYIKYNSYLCNTIKLEYNIMGKKKTLEIRRWDNNEVIFSYTCEDNCFAKTLNKAIIDNIDLSYADLSHQYLGAIDLSNANLFRAYVKDSTLDSIIISDTTKLESMYPLNDQCPKEGSFIGWKKCCNYNGDEYIVKLEIPADAKRCSSTGVKCRCSKAKVLEILNLDGSVADIKIVSSLYFNDFYYELGEMIYPDSFDDRYWIECSNGIHFFINRDTAINYVF